MPTAKKTAAKKTTPAKLEPTAQHHSRLDSFINIMERFGAVALTLAPAVAAPFVKNPQSQAIIAAEAPIAAALATALGNHAEGKK